MEKSGTPQGQDQTAKKTDKPQDGGALGNRLPPEGQKPPPPPEHNNPDDHSGQAPWWKRLEVWKFIGEMVLVVIGIYLACVYSGQLTQMIESNKINRESLTSVQRAFVTFQQINLDTIPLNLQELQKNERQWIFTAIVENDGTTPAINKIQYFTGRNDLPNEPSEQEFIGSQKDRPVGEIGPKAQKGIGPMIKTDAFVLGNYPLGSIGTTEFTAFFRSRRVFLWGWVAYRDVFPNTHPHVTEFCEEVNGIGAGLQGPRLSRLTNIQIQQLRPRLNFKECTVHNCTDEHCEDYQKIITLVPK